MADKPKRRGRVTPPKQATTRRPDHDVAPSLDKLGQVGRQPSSPLNLFVIAVVWIACGAFALAFLKASWKVVPGVVMIGIGLFFLRGAFTVVMRHEARRRRP